MTGNDSAFHIMAVLLPKQKVQGVSFQVHVCQSAPWGWVCAVQKKNQLSKSPLRSQHFNF